MVKRAFIRANIPFVIYKNEKENPDFIKKATAEGWNRFEMYGDFLLKHINSSFANNVVCLSKKCDKKLVVPIKYPAHNQVSRMCDIVIEEVQVYCFDTGIGICTLQIPYDNGADEDDVTDVCSKLYRSVSGSDCCVDENGANTYLSVIAQEMLDSIFNGVVSYKLFGTSNQTAFQRINMFSGVLLENTDDLIKADPSHNDKYCFQLANAYDNRDKNLSVNGCDLYYQHNYTRWSFSTRGCAVVANITGVEQNDEFLKSRWFVSIQSNYFYLYLMALHQKFATYNYLNIIAEDPNMNQFEINQKALLDFNSKYIFSIVSDEQFIQDVFLRFKSATNVDNAYIELQDQLKKMFDYARFKSNESLEQKNQSMNLISVIISVVCSISVIFDTANLFVSNGFALGFQTLKNCVFTGVVSLEVLLFVLVLGIVILINKKKNK